MKKDVNIYKPKEANIIKLKEYLKNSDKVNISNLLKQYKNK
jgi:hypothetical protein